MKIYINGIYNAQKWQDSLLSKLKMEYFIPESIEKNENTAKLLQTEKNTADYLLYIITPKMQDMFIVSELIDDSNKRPAKVLFCYLANFEDGEFNKHQIKSLIATGKMVRANGGQWFETLDETIQFLVKTQ